MEIFAILFVILLIVAVIVFFFGCIAFCADPDGGEVGIVAIIIAITIAALLFIGYGAARGYKLNITVSDLEDEIIYNDNETSQLPQVNGEDVDSIIEESEQFNGG